MLMKLLNGAFALLLALATAALGMFFLCSQDEHRQLLAQHFWPTLGLGLLFAGSAGLLAAGVWWGINWLLRKAGWLPDIDLRRTAWLLAVGVATGSVAGAALFCLP